MVPVISIVGRKNSGKTTLIEGIIPELKKKGYRVGTIKHHSHDLELEDIDREGKDTYKHQLCGENAVVLSAPNKLMLFRVIEESQQIDDIRHTYLHSLDIILTEGYKLEDKPKIEVFRHQIGGDEGLLCNQKDNNLVAVATDYNFDLGIPCFGLDAYKDIADFIEQTIIQIVQLPKVSLVVNGKNIPLNGFVCSFMQRTIMGMLQSLRGVPENPKTVEIRIG
ncbi:molybdopterin-guanine dinucleotide biosynthesis protein B [Candidatus Desantisbacteria bacterium CG_4_9_14_3_um_filter_40_11]|uniref:Molybdopterin-guanine dinucleotide biosynthesis protein B n=4 Tax=unclassified Candidatus Desantisiibacteriota TaxID=3106372 RepID=A0A2M7JDP0_9BACT|nr:MAG: molybdopterin-guanine dinucleotide biosynthesis protein B [Candidatus Desantisbacteria bacterium CG_4_8_14_3_um_filter_40_12]PJB28356.1 MAG: molybdopterin-guanine dinucleotide biosynthesis protein B [Candidatus Desantisbacteria bacterium CG_4_9_14_3_um_filter_40_11]